MSTAMLELTLEEVHPSITGRHHVRMYAPREGGTCAMACDAQGKPLVGAELLDYLQTMGKVNTASAYTRAGRVER